MADDTAALVVALSAQLTKFEKDMKSAVGIADTNVKAIETRFSQMNQTINSQLSGFVQGYASRLGGLGAVLGSVGGLGLTIAAGVGAAVVAIGFLNQKADEFVKKQKAMQEASEVTGLTLDQLKAVGQAATRTGVDFEKAERGIIKMATAIDDLRSKGSGPLLDSLNKLNPELVKQIINADSSAEAFDILGKALSQMEGDFRAVGFSAELFGKRNVEVMRVLQDLVKQGGLVKAALDLREQGKGVDIELVERLRKLQVEIDATKKRADNMFGASIALLDKQAELDQAKIAEKTAAGMLAASNYMRDLVNAVSDYISKGPQVEATTSKLPGQQPGLTRVKPFKLSDIFGMPTATREQINKMYEGLTVDVPLPKTRAQADQEAIDAEEKRKALMAVNITFLERWNSLLGAAADPAERYAAEQNKINRALLDYKEGSPEYNKLVAAGARALNVLNQEQVIAAANLRERLMLLTEDQIVELKLNQIKLDAQKTGQKDLDLTNATIVARKQAKEAIEAQAAALSKLPESTRYAQQALDGFKNADQFLTTFSGNFENAMGDIASGSKKASEAFKALADSIIKDLIRITIRMTVTGPLLKAISGFFSGGVLPGGAPLGQGGVGHAQEGGPVKAGHPYVVGEAGPELFVPKTAGRIIPNSVGGTATAGGMSVTVNNYTAPDTDIRQSRQQGPNGETLIIDVVKRNMARGAFDDTNRGRFGLRAQKVR